MTTSSYTQLLQVALEDLRLARCATADRLPAIASSVVDEETQSLFSSHAAAARNEQERLAAIIEVGEGDPNLWAPGILDDASRDVRSSIAGPVRDIALIGAIRKLIAADIVSLETASALAKVFKDQQARALEQMRAAALDRDAQLRLRLEALARGAASAQL